MARTWAQVSEYEKNLFKTRRNVSLLERLALRCYWTWLGIKQWLKEAVR